MLNPTISVIVATYNSGNYVLETLDSIKCQSFKDFEIIICDDCSTDNTVNMVRDWATERASSLRTKLVVGKFNQGLVANLNNGLKLASGKWIKIMAADDLLTEDALESYIEFVNNNENVKALCAGFDLFKGLYLKDKLFSPSYRGYSKFYNNHITAEQQFKRLLLRNFLHGPTFFVDRTLLLMVGAFDNRYRFEDLPIAIRLTMAGEKIYFLDKVVLHYRLHEASISGTSGKLYSNFYKELYKFDKEVIFEHASFFVRWCKTYEYKRDYWFDRFGLNTNNRICKFIYKVLLIINPLYVYNRYL